MKRSASLCGMLAVLLMLFAVPATAQETAGSIEGVVKDTSGAVLPGVAVEARNPQGAVVSVDQRPGRQVSIQRAGPGPLHRLGDADRVQEGQLRERRAVARPGAEDQLRHGGRPHRGSPGQRRIADHRRQAERDDASITADVIDRIPKGRNFTSVVQIAPGANDEARNGGIQFDGSSGSENRFVIDGMDTTNLRTGVSGKTVYTEFL